MSATAAVAFIEALQVDPVLFERIQLAESPAEVIALAAEAGYDFDADDLSAAMLAHGGAAELSDTDLDGVAAGGQWLNTVTTWIGTKAPDPAATGLAGGSSGGGASERGATAGRVKPPDGPGSTD